MLGGVTRLIDDPGGQPQISHVRTPRRLPAITDVERRGFGERYCQAA
jgi:hypothetical protein